MDSITIPIIIGEDRHLDIQLPPEVPPGPAELVVRSRELETSPVTNPAREAARAKLRAAGLLSTAHRAPEGTTELTPEERERIWSQFAGGRSIDDLINEDRGEY